MSYVLTASSISTPVSIANGGTGSTTKGAAMIALTSAAFNNSAQTATWGTEEPFHYPSFLPKHLTLPL